MMTYSQHLVVWMYLTVVIGFSPTTTAFCTRMPQPPPPATSLRSLVTASTRPAQPLPPTVSLQSRVGKHRALLFRTNRRLSPLSALPVPILPGTVPTALSATTALLVSTAAGLTVQRVLPNASILATLATAAIISNTGLVPVAHALYDVCWTTLLPASLALLLLSLQSSKTNKDATVGRVVQDLALPFGLATIGSIMGCLLAFFSRRAVGLSGPDAAQAAACLVASLIGGSVNFFATAAALSGAAGSRSSATGSATTLMSSMAAADLVVMAVYFAVLDGALWSPRLRKWFVRRSNAKEDEPVQQVSALPTTYESLEPEIGEAMSTPATISERIGRVLQTTRSLVLVSTLALAIVQVATRFERAVSHIIPGTACAVIAALTPIIQRRIPDSKLRNVQSVAAPLSQVCFLCLFASIGMSANLGQALRSGPSCLLFSSVALLVHVVTVFAGSLWVGGVRLEDVLVASNAAVGGPATAAAFSGRIPPSPRSQGLFLAATVWGVVGYAVGTTIGVTMFRVLRAFV